MDTIIAGFTKYGLIGVILGAAFWYIIFLHNKHDKERSEWKEIAKDSTNAIREHTSVLSALKQLLETTRDKK